MMEDYGLTQYRLAKELGIQQIRLSQVLKGKRAISADTAMRLGRFFGTSTAMWMTLQQNYDIEVAERENGEAIERVVRPFARRSRNPSSSAAKK